MEPRSQIGIVLIALGAGIVLCGLAVLFFWRIPYIGHLPGDINLSGKGWSFHFPLMTGIILSVVLTVITVILNLFFRR